MPAFDSHKSGSSAAHLVHFTSAFYNRVNWWTAAFRCSVLPGSTGGGRITARRAKAGRCGRAIGQSLRVNQQPPPALQLAITSNQKMEEWLSLFDDFVLGNSALDRLANASCRVIVEGQIYRERLSPHRGSRGLEEVIAPNSLLDISTNHSPKGRLMSVKIPGLKTLICDSARRAGTHRSEESAPKAGRQRRQPRLHLHRAQGRLPHGREGSEDLSLEVESGIL